MRVSWPYPVRTSSGFPGEGTVLREERAPEQAGTRGLFSAPSGEPAARFAGLPKAVYMDSVLATDEPYLLRYYGRDEEGNWGARWLEARMGMDAARITATIDKPSGVPLGWQHDVGYLDSPAPVGRVLSMEVKGGRLVGDVAVSPAELGKYLANSVEDIDLASGLSIGFFPTEPPSIELAGGTREDPDQMTYEAYRVFETSLVPIPALLSAGLNLAKTPGKADGGEQSQGETDPPQEGNDDE